MTTKPATVLTEPKTDEPTEDGACPDCGSTAINVHGLLDCPDCGI